MSGFVESAKKLQKSSKSKDRHIGYCLRKLFCSTSEKLHDDEVLSLVDSVLDGNGLEVSDKLLKEYKAAKEVVVRVKSLMELMRLAKESERQRILEKMIRSRNARWWTASDIYLGEALRAKRLQYHMSADGQAAREDM